MALVPRDQSKWNIFVYSVLLAFSGVLSLIQPNILRAETTHQIFFKGTDSELDVFTIEGAEPGPTLLLLGGIQGDEPGGYLAADLYADVSLKKGKIIVVPRANFLSIVENSRGVVGDMNRKFAAPPKLSDRDFAVVKLVKDLMKKSDVFLNLHDGSGYYSSKWVSPERNAMRYGQSIIADTDEYTLPNGKKLHMGSIVKRVLDRVNPQIANPDHAFNFNNHMTSRAGSKHKEQRKSATYHALTGVGIPAFGVETSKNIRDFRLRVRYQSLVINAFLEEFGIIMENPKLLAEDPRLRYLVVSINDRTPIVVSGDDILKIQEGDIVRIVHIESNYSRGLSAQIKGSGKSFNHLNEDVPVKENTTILVRKDRFVIGAVPVEIVRGTKLVSSGIHFEPAVKHFCVQVNSTKYIVEPGEELAVYRGDTLTILDPKTNLEPADEKVLRVDLRGFQAENSPYPTEDRGHQINTADDLQEQYARKRDTSLVFPLLAKLNTKIIGECSIVVNEPKLHYVILRNADGSAVVAFAGEKLDLPSGSLYKIVDVKTNMSETSVPLFITMSGKSVRWGPDGETGIDSSKLPEQETPLDVVRNGRSLGRIWLKQGSEVRFSGKWPPEPSAPVKY